MRHVKTLFGSIAIVAMVAVPQIAAAQIIDGTNSDFTVEWFLAAGAQDNDGGAVPTFDLSASAIFDVVTYSYDAMTGQTTVKFNIDFTNTTSTTGGENAGITSFGLGVDPNLIGLVFSDVNDGGFTSAIIQTNQQNYPGGFKNIDVCIFTEGCSGGSQGSAIAANGGSDSFMLTMLFAGDIQSIILDPFPIKFQTNAGSFEFDGCVDGNRCTTVPEPGSLALLGAGLLALGFTRRRRPA